MSDRPGRRRLSTQELNEKVQREALRLLLAENSGYRTFVIDLWRDAGVFYTPRRQHGDDTMVAIGRLELGLEVLHRLAKIAPETVAQMMGELFSGPADINAERNPQEPDDDLDPDPPE